MRKCRERLIFVETESANGWLDFMQQEGFLLFFWIKIRAFYWCVTFDEFKMFNLNDDDRKLERRRKCITHSLKKSQCPARIDWEQFHIKKLSPSRDSNLACYDRMPDLYRHCRIFFNFDCSMVDNWLFTILECQFKKLRKLQKLYTLSGRLCLLSATRYITLHYIKTDALTSQVTLRR